MASVPTASVRTMSIGRVFSRAFGAIGANPAQMFGMTILLIGIPGALLNLFAQGYRYNQALATTTPLSPIAMLTTFVFTLASILLAVVAQGALIRATALGSDNQPVSFGHCAKVGLRKALPMIGLTLLIALLVTIGLVLLIVPGVIFYVIVSVAAAALVEEDAGVFASLSRSAALTKGARWNVFATLCVAIVFYWLISLVSGIVLVAALGVQGMVTVSQSGSGSVIFLLVNMISSTLLITVFSALQTSLYIELREWKEGPAAVGLSQIFD